MCECGSTKKRVERKSGRIHEKERKTQMSLKDITMSQEAEDTTPSKIFANCDMCTRMAIQGLRSIAPSSGTGRPNISSRKASGTLANGDAVKSDAPLAVACAAVRCIAERAREMTG